MAQQLLIFIKNPLLGTVKTRLAKDIGSIAARDAYEQMIRFTLKQAAGLEEGIKQYLYYNHFIDNGDGLAGEKIERKLQKGANLGEKMAAAIKEVSRGETEGIIIIGSDCLELNTTILEEAFEALKQFPVVIGPAKDGGYYLIGVQKPVEELFDGIDWSTDQVLGQTLQILKEKNLEYHLLETLTDVDTEKEWLAFKHWLKS